ncbi:MAG: bifunctional folylpolyglutamate synthase/dihydrofolate synthase [Clostridia bacterium]|nr:bifunctional folylpolyglutamate synthase/dihydrofolate synthase [Clostridia bacterium]
MTYESALEYIHKVNWTFCKPGLERISELCEKLGNPQDKLKFIHVAGTNGKGSFCSMLSSILTDAGYKTGLYTSPYIKSFNERMRVNGENIPNDALAKITERVRPIADSMTDKPTEFELITAIAFEYFLEAGCEVVVLEAGMGGRLDSTNIIKTPSLSVITGIALDHTDYLGDTPEKIAAEKAGIIKSGVPILYGGDSQSAREVIESRAKDAGSPFFEVDYSALQIKSFSLEGSEFSYKARGRVKINLLGEYQPRNAAIVLEAVDILRSCGMNIPEDAVLSGLWRAEWHARFEIISRDPLVIFDGAHNPQGIASAVESVKRYFKDKRPLVLTGVLRDKDYRFIAKKLSEIADEAVTLTPASPRALSAEEYADVLSENGVKTTPVSNIKGAFLFAKERARELNTPLVCLGSLYTYVDIIDFV